MDDKRKVKAENYRRNHYSENRTHGEMAVEYMKKYGSITSDEAFLAFDCRRLAAVIFRLKRDYPIRTKRDEAYGTAIYRIENKM